MITPYINFNGNCEEAFEYYSEVFQDGKPIIAKYGNSLGINKEYKYIDTGKVMHGYVGISENGGISGSDTEEKLENGNKIFLNIIISPTSKAEKVFNKLVGDGILLGEFKNNPPPHEKSSSGAVKDKYGVTWIIAGNN